ncbi:MAG: hypothetical protein QOG34_2380 [Frankiaceae bacterium]|jgi:hypothetical protein|nr:hypothetical protein [Frankiaceae bacterium]
MRRFLVAIAVGLGAITAVPGTAHAGASDTAQGGCGFISDDGARGDGVYTGVIYDLSVTTKRGIPRIPTDATVNCWLDINWVEAPGTRFAYSGFGVQAGADPVTYAAGPTDIVVECYSVEYADSTTESGCPADLMFRFPPQDVIELLDDTFAFVNGPLGDAFALTDAVLCPALVKIPGTYGLVTIAPDGDVSIAAPLGLGPDLVYYDCPPYVSYGE